MSMSMSIANVQSAMSIANAERRKKAEQLCSNVMLCSNGGDISTTYNSNR